MKSETTVAPSIERLSNVLGTTLEPERLASLLAAFEPIRLEIAGLRTLDLTDVHPAIIYDPSAPYRRAGK